MCVFSLRIDGLTVKGKEKKPRCLLTCGCFWKNRCHEIVQYIYRAHWVHKS